MISLEGVFSPSSHRIAVFDHTGAINNIISQSDIIRFLHTRRDKIAPDLLNANVESLFLGGNAKHVVPDVQVVPSTLPAIQVGIAFHSKNNSSSRRSSW